MNRTLLTQALIKFLAGILLTGVLVFLPAGSFAYWQGWLLMGVLFVPMFFAGIVMLAKNPDLLRKRLNAPPYSISHWITAATALTPAQMPPNQAQLRLGQIGKVPVILPVCPFIAKT